MKTAVLMTTIFGAVVIVMALLVWAQIREKRHLAALQGLSPDWYHFCRPRWINLVDSLVYPMVVLMFLSFSDSEVRSWCFFGASVALAFLHFYFILRIRRNWKTQCLSGSFELRGLIRNEENTRWLSGAALLILGALLGPMRTLWLS